MSQGPVFTFLRDYPYVAIALASLHAIPCFEPVWLQLKGVLHNDLEEVSRQLVHYFYGVENKQDGSHWYQVLFAQSQHKCISCKMYCASGPSLAAYQLCVDCRASEEVVRKFTEGVMQTKDLHKDHCLLTINGLLSIEDIADKAIHSARALCRLRDQFLAVLRRPQFENQLKTEVLPFFTGHLALFSCNATPADLAHIPNCTVEGDDTLDTVLMKMQTLLTMEAHMMRTNKEMQRQMSQPSWTAFGTSHIRPKPTPRTHTQQQQQRFNDRVPPLNPHSTQNAAHALSVPREEGGTSHEPAPGAAHQCICSQAHMSDPLLHDWECFKPQETHVTSYLQQVNRLIEKKQRHQQQHVTSSHRQDMRQPSPTLHSQPQAVTTKRERTEAQMQKQNTGNALVKQAMTSLLDSDMLELGLI